MECVWTLMINNYRFPVSLIVCWCNSKLKDFELPKEKKRKRIIEVWNILPKKYGLKMTNYSWFWALLVWKWQWSLSHMLYWIILIKQLKSNATHLYQNINKPTDQMNNHNFLLGSFDLELSAISLFWFNWTKTWSRPSAPSWLD